MTRTIRIGSRKSRLALVQSEHVGSLLAADPEVRYEIVRVDTAGDKQRDVPLPEVGGKGLFTAELEEMLRAGSVDIAVHSLKDLPGELGAGLVVGAVGAREDPRDVLVARGGGTLAELPAGARVGTGSVRRAAQILSLRPDVAIASIRGNVPTRLEKLDRGEYDAVVLAAAGLHRLGL
ncbi:MAG: hydroxymethylbilane synthase, partial [Candidatus Krumholzibacteria bacterium]|nr:hydroxymethylbilane synthase [Candidatus Krumholzibacteria bacterium]